MAQKQSKKPQEDKSVWTRLMLWVRRNEKVLFVLLLGVMAFSFAFGAQIGAVFRGGGRSLELGFGRSIGVADFQAREDVLVRTMRFARPVLASVAGEGNLTLGNFETVNVREILMHEGVAWDLGLRVSDDELEARVRELWQVYTASDRAAASLERKGVVSQGPNDYGYRFQEQQEIGRIAAILAKENVFDPEDYSEMVKRATNLRLNGFEEAFRTLLLVARLGEHVVSTINVTPKEVFEQFQNDRHRRKLRWTEVIITDELREKLAATLTPQEIEQYYGDHRSELEQGTRLRFQWLRAKRESYLADAEASATEEALRAAYLDDRGQHMKPGIFAGAGAFELLSAEEKAAREAATFRPYEEVADDVRERYILRTSNDRLRDLAVKLRSQLYPRPPGDTQARTISAPAMSFTDAAAADQHLTTGTTEFATQAEAEKVFGDLYSGATKSKIDSWFEDVKKSTRYELSEASQSSLRFETNVPDDKVPGGRVNDSIVYFTAVEIKAPGVPELADAREKVVDALVARRLNDLVAALLEKKVEAIRAGDTQFAALAMSALEVELAGGEKATVELGAIEDSGTVLVQKTYGRVMVAKKEAPSAATESEEKDPSVIDEVAHESSDALRNAVFGLEKLGDVTVARDDAKGACFLVEYAARSDPDPGDFKVYRPSIERQMLQERREVEFTAWRAQIYERARFEGELPTAR